MTLSLFLLMGVSWLNEAISFWVGGSAFIWILPDVLNICTGIFIFIVFILKPKVFKLLKTKYPCLSRLDPFCPSCMLEESSNHYHGKRRSFFPHHQRQIATTANFNSENGGKRGSNHSPNQQRRSTDETNLSSEDTNNGTNISSTTDTDISPIGE